MTKEEFVKKHNHYGYTEIIILSNGDIEYSVPSHIYKLIEISGKSKDYLDKLMPITANPVDWLCDYTNCCAIWYNCGNLPHNFTEEQKETILYLHTNKLINNGFYMIRNYEKDRTEKLEKEDFDNLIDIERYMIENNEFVSVDI